MTPFNYALYLVTDETACLGRDLIYITEQAVKGGVDIVQLREKNLSDKAFLKRALMLKEMLDRYHVPLIINDHLAIATACNASGIHVGNEDISPAAVLKAWPDCGIIGYSLETEEQLYTERAELSAYLALSPVFSTPTKQNTITEWKLEGVRKIRSLTGKPLIAIGGITLENTGNIIKAGADCIAVVSAVCSAKDPALAAEQLRNEIEKHKTQHI